LFLKALGIRELPHIGAAKNMRTTYRQALRDVGECKMLAWIIAVVVTVGLIWSVAAMSNVVPVLDGSNSTAISRPAE
jgi:hypothetical protein